MKIYPSLSELRPDIIKYWSNKNECIPSEMRVSLYSHKYVWVICPLCNKEFQKTYNAIINSGCYCKECSNKVCSKYEKSLRYKYPDIADMYDSSEKNKLSSDKVFSRSDEEYYFKCNYKNVRSQDLDFITFGKMTINAIKIEF